MGKKGGGQVGIELKVEVEVEREVQVEVEVEGCRCTSETILRCTSETILRCTSEYRAAEASSNRLSGQNPLQN